MQDPKGGKEKEDFIGARVWRDLGLVGNQWREREAGGREVEIKG